MPHTIKANAPIHQVEKQKTSNHLSTLFFLVLRRLRRWLRLHLQKSSLRPNRERVGKFASFGTAAAAADSGFSKRCSSLRGNRLSI
jgi:hypothetical protein